MDSSVSSEIDELDDTTPLPELSLYDLLDTPTTTKEQHLNAADNDNDDDDVEEDDDDDECEDEEYLSSSMNESLNTPRPKKPPIVRILENKRLSGPAPIGSALKNMLGGPIRIVTTPTKPNQATDVKIIKKVQPQTFKSFANTPVKIGSTTIGTPTGAATSTSTAKNVAGVTMTQIKTADGKLLYLHKSMPVCSVSGAGQKVPLSTSTTTTRVVSQSPTSGGYIRQTILPKGVTITSGGLIKSAASGSPIAVRGLTIGQSKSITPTTTTTSPSSAAASTSVSTATATVTNKMPIKVVRTADGKLIKLNQGASPVLLNTKSAGVTVRAAGSTTASVTTAALGNSSTGNVVISKPTAQVIIKGPVKQLPAGASIRPVINNINSATVTATTGNINSNNASGSGNTLVGVTTSPSTATSTATATLTAGKMLVQSSTGKHIVVASKNIIKLSPKPSNSSSNSSIANTSTSATATPSGLHAIQLPGKSGVQYVRVLPTNATKVTTSPQKVPLGRPRTISGNSNNTNTTNSNNNSLTGSMDSTKKIVMRTTVALSGGSIVPLPTMQTLVPRRAPGATGTAKTVVGKSGNNNTSLEAARKHRLSELNVQIKQLTSDSSSSDIVGPEAKKARYVIAMPQTSTTSASSSSTTATTAVSQQQLQKMTSTRPATAAAGVQRVTVQGASGSGNVASSGNVTRKVYNLVTKGDAKGFKYMICNKGGEGKPRTVFNTTMRRGYTLADTKLRRPTTLTPQQVRFKQMKLQQQRQVLAQAQAKMRQQQHQQQQPHDKQQQQSPQSKQQQQQQTSAQANKASVPGKPLFDILKPPPTPTPAPAATTAIDALGGSRRKHCNCSKSQCLKLYCDCFANGEFCQDCTCKDCFNNLDYEVKRERAIRSCLERNPSAFKPKITAPNSGDMRLHNKGCNCKRSGCLKNYCECYEAKIPCSAMCKCVGCRNMEDRPDVDMDSMDSLIDVKLHASKMKELNGTVQPDNRSNVYLTDDVIEATIMCMLSRIVMHEKQGMQIEDTERVVMEELGESLNQIITFAKEKNDTIQTDDPKTTA